MKISNIGIILLTLMVVVKYFISQNTLTHKDGALGDGLVVDYRVVQKELLQHSVPQIQTSLLAYNPASVNNIADNSHETGVSYHANRVTHLTDEQTTNHTFAVHEPEESNDPVPVEYANTLVVYDPSNPVIAQMAYEYTDPEDSEPLDQGNTLVNEMQLMMPRR